MINLTHINEAVLHAIAKADGHVIAESSHKDGVATITVEFLLEKPLQETVAMPAIPAGPADVRDLPVTRIDPHHAKVRLLLKEITGAGMAVLHAIAKAGGHVIADPPHQAAIGQALRALEKRVQEALDLPAILED